MGPISKHLRSNVVGYVALFMALSGTAYAVDGPLAGQNTVGERDIINGEVYSVDVRNDTLPGGGLGPLDLRAGSVRTSELKNDQVFSADVRNDTLPGGGLGAPDLRAGSVGTSEAKGLTGADIADTPSGSDDINAERLDGLDATDFQAAGAAASGDLAGTYPNPSIANGAVTPDKLGTVPAVRADTGTNSSWCTEQTITSGSEVPIRFPFERFDTASMHSATGCTDTTGSDSIVAPRAGIYEISAGVHWSGNADGYRQLALELLPAAGGSSYLASQSTPALPGASDLMQQVSTIAKLDQSDVISLLGFQNSGAILLIAKGDSRSYLAMTWLGPS